MNAPSGDSKSGPVLLAAMLAYGLAQLWAGYTGIDYHLGFAAAIAAVAVAMLFRFTLPLTIGAFFGAMDVWGWPWPGALAFALPGLAFLGLLVPGMLAGKWPNREGDG